MSFTDLIFIGMIATLFTGLLFLILSYEGQDEDLEHCKEGEI